MAVGPATQISDVVVPARFTPYAQQLTERKTRLVQSGAISRSPLLDEQLQGGGLTFNLPSFLDLDNDAENIATDDIADMIALSNSGASPALPASFNDAIPLKIETATEIGVRLVRNNSWSTMQLAALLAGSDPQAAIGARVANYWQERLQALFIAIWKGVILDNVVSNSADYQNDLSTANGSTFLDGVTNFTAEALIDTAVTAGDSMDKFTMLMVHSIVYARMQRLNLIDTIPDSRGETMIDTFQGKEVIIDDSMPRTGNLYDSWLFGPGATQLGMVEHPRATRINNIEAAAQGDGQEVLHSRVVWSMHPVGHAYVGTPANGGPGNGTGTNDFENAGSWSRVYPERKQIPFARLVTREA